MSDDTTDWTDLHEFFGVDLTQSYALSWHIEKSSLLIDLDLYLKKEHPLYEEPRPAEKACFRPAFLEFPDCTRATTANETNEELAAVVNTIDPGKIAGLRRVGDGRYEVRGDFGTIEIASDRPLLKIKDLSA
ncbi:MAG: hypothetical protein ACI88G_000394 [Woeseiaceae bacterium]|jgi:hypothetical protein